MFNLLQYAFGVLAGTCLVIARPLIHKRQANSIPTITGAIQGGVQSRLEIHALQSNEDQWNIYLLALAAFQAMDPTDPESWYQIAGIHGVPYVPWGGVEACPSCNPNTGYCTHSSTLFPTWHRAYLGLFEQSLQANAIAVANQFTGNDRTRYLKAATSLRMPYWDWAQTPPNGETAFPQMFTSRTVEVNAPNGQQTIQNPLASYSFGSADHSFMSTSYTRDSDVTYRIPSFTSQTQQLLQQDLYTTLTSNHGYSTFSTESLHRYRDNWSPFSIEMLHDRVHVRVGGDMGFIPTAAFDPIFWLHHAAIDHAFALWQAAYPNAWLEPWREIGSSFTYTSGTMEDGQSPLTPFRANTNGGFWSSNDVRGTESLGYNYADLASGASAASIINTLYGGGAVVSRRDDNESRIVHEYVADITADSMGMEGSFTVYFFDGSIHESDADSWADSDAFMTSHAFFTGTEKKGDGSALSNAGVSLSPALRRAVSAGELASFEFDDVQEYLKKNLRWRVRMLHGDAVDAKSIPGFDVTILTADVKMPANSNELPEWGKFTVLQI